MSDFTWSIPTDEFQLFSIKIEGVKGSILASAIAEEDNKVGSIDGSKFLQNAG